MSAERQIPMIHGSKRDVSKHSSLCVNVSKVFPIIIAETQRTATVGSAKRYTGKTGARTKNVAGTVDEACPRFERTAASLVPRKSWHEPLGSCVKPRPYTRASSHLDFRVVCHWRASSLASVFPPVSFPQSCLTNTPRESTCLSRGIVDLLLFNRFANQPFDDLLGV